MNKNEGLDITNIDLNYEDALRKLEETIESLERDDQTLEKAITKFEQGQILAAYCLNLLNKAELRVRNILDNYPLD
jgi:exodeoxyribonuclease VII small subunit